MADADGNIFGPFDVTVPGSEAESFTEEAYYRIHDESGVVSGGALTFAGLTAKLAPIFAWSHGAYLVRDTTWESLSPPTTGPEPRRDLLVLRRILTVGEGEGAEPGRCIPVVLRGTPAASNPQNPEHDPAIDTRLWSWQVPGNGGTVVTGQQDHRVYVNRNGSPSATSQSVPMIQLTGTGTQGVNPGAWRRLTLSTVMRNRGFNVVAGEAVVITPGVYLCSGDVAYSVGVQPNKRYIAALGENFNPTSGVGVNTRTQGRGDPSDGSTTSIPTATYQLQLAAGDRLSLLTRSDADAAENVDRVQSFLQAVWIGPPA